MSAVPEREVAAAAAATTAARDVRPESRRRRRPLQSLAPGPLVSRTRARVEEQGRREARLQSASRPHRAPPSFLVPAPGATALVLPPRPRPPAGRESPAAAAAATWVAPCGGQRVGRGSLPALSSRHLGRGPSGAGAWGRVGPGTAAGLGEGALGREPQRGRHEPGPGGGRGTGGVFVVGDRDPSRRRRKAGKPLRIGSGFERLHWWFRGGER